MRTLVDTSDEHGDETYDQMRSTLREYARTHLAPKLVEEFVQRLYDRYTKLKVDVAFTSWLFELDKTKVALAVGKDIYFEREFQLVARALAGLPGHDQYVVDQTISFLIINEISRRDPDSPALSVIFSSDSGLPRFRGE